VRRSIGNAKADLHEIWMAESRAAAEQAFDHFLTNYELKYAKAAECNLTTAYSFVFFSDICDRAGTEAKAQWRSFVDSLSPRRKVFNFNSK
jgi:hypothetical protein